MAVSRINEAGLNVNQYGNRNVIINGAMQVAQRVRQKQDLQMATWVLCLDRFKFTGKIHSGRSLSNKSTDFT